MEDGRSEDRILKLIRHGVAAGGLRRAARDYPEARRGLTKAADHHSARCSALTGEMMRLERLGPRLDDQPEPLPRVGGS